MNKAQAVKFEVALVEAREALAAGNATQACAIVLVAMLEMTVDQERRDRADREGQDEILRGAAPPATKAS